MRPLITTSRLDLRPFRSGDADELHEVFADPLTHLIGDGPFSSIDQTRSWIQRRVELERNTGLLWYAVRERSCGRLLGNCGLFAGRTGITEPEIGYEIRHAFQGLGYATEAAHLVLREGFAAGLPRIWATIRPHNTTSLRVATKIGMSEQYTAVDQKGPLTFLASAPPLTHHRCDDAPTAG
ncbi:GNAT family N-acetyltransferase [Micromonospora sp. Llam7]|uniref:GNAT family N-acetyltransferase n=1 Tax=Micromonospora tarapacensis TaxID=2835305 RepID=UPI001C83B481|nr:GNAT family N-acetyltransferase [Micromonospora tarapacensis]MBX7270030.1 GNAT family N-acetyltransferase [Micromonospora tarapacensis]